MTSARTRHKPSAPRSIRAGNDNAPLVANDNRPSVILLGDLPVLSRHPIDRLSPGELGRINRIEAALRGRNKREASRLALDFEVSQGITTEERIAAMEPANDIDRIIEAALGLAVTTYSDAYEAPKPVREKKLKGKKKPKPKKVDPYEGFPIGDLRQDEIDQVDAAEVKLQSRDLKTKKEGMETMDRIRRAVRARLHQKAVSDGLSEIRSLEALRGASVERSTNPDHAGGMIVSGRDGLETLMTAGSLTFVQHAAGLRYRTDYEALDPGKGLTPPALDQTRNIVRGGEGYAEKRREIEERVFGIHCMICGIEPPTGKNDRRALPALPKGHPSMRAIHALDAIAGRGDNLGTMTTSGSVKARIREDLIFALDACAIVYGLE